jgi:hypothetical protein
MNTNHIDFARLRRMKQKMSKIMLAFVVLMVLSISVFATDVMPTCQDSDGGYDIFEKGKLDVYTPNFGSQTVFEYCVSESGNKLSTGGYVEELVCLEDDAEFAYEHKKAKCPEGYQCADGACKQEVVETDYSCDVDSDCNKFGAHKECIQGTCDYPSCDYACKNYYDYDKGACGPNSFEGNAMGSAYCEKNLDQCYCENEDDEFVNDCTETDGGVSYYHAGRVKLGNGLIAEDFCRDATHVAEFRCSVGYAGWDVMPDYYCPNGCEDGACKTSSQVVEEDVEVEDVVPVCKDSDGGIQYFTSGYTNGESEGMRVYGHYRDSCGDYVGDTGKDSGSYVIETHCSGPTDNPYVHKQWYKCPEGCSYGACVKEEQAVETPVVPVVVPVEVPIPGSFVSFEVGVNNYPEHQDYSLSKNLVGAYVNVYVVDRFQPSNYKGWLRETIQTDRSGVATVKVKPGEVVGFVGFVNKGNAQAATSWIFGAPPYKNFGTDGDRLCQINTNANKFEYLQNNADYACATSLSTPYQDKRYQRDYVEQRERRVVQPITVDEKEIPEAIQCLDLKDCDFSESVMEDLIVDGWEEVYSDADEDVIQCFASCKVDLKSFLIDLDPCLKKVEYGAAKPTNDAYEQCLIDAVDAAEIKPMLVEETVEEVVPQIKECNGCFMDDRCIPFGTRIVDGRDPKYCAPMTGLFEKQLGSDMKCQNGFECETNLCVEGQCVESRGLFYRFLKWVGLA